MVSITTWSTSAWLQIKGLATKYKAVNGLFTFDLNGKNQSPAPLLPGRWSLQHHNQRPWGGKTHSLPVNQPESSENSCEKLVNTKKYIWIITLNFHEWPRQDFSLLYLYNIMQTSDKNKEKYQLCDYWWSKYQILQTNIMRIIWQTVGRITIEILGVKGLNYFPHRQSMKKQ